ncbi:MAG: hypothetical protein NC217_06055 [Muribaculaceae bacterium]|nr:hypothetical protein [Muribaculaceae bacterium]
MERLNGKTFIIGREEGQSRLLIAWQDAPQGQKSKAIIPVNVPNFVTRCQPQIRDKGHLCLAVQPDGNIIVSNLNIQNHTYVNGVEIASRRVSPLDTVELGLGRFKIEINKLLNAAMKLVPVQTPPPPKQLTVNIRHLEDVWNNYDKAKKAIKARQRNVNLIRGIMSVFSAASIFIRLAFEDETVQTIGTVLLVVSLLGAIYSFLVLKQNNVAEEEEELLIDFQDHYLCPNCHKFLGNMRYVLMKRQTGMQCPYCKSKFEE